MRIFKQTIGAIAIFSLLASCASTTLIKTESTGVKVYADGSLLGTAPVTYSDTKIVGSSTTFMLKKEGCRDQTFAISRSEEFQVGPCIGGVFIGVPFLWIMGYRAERTFPFECEPKS
jgi:hypothetical protein